MGRLFFPEPCRSCKYRAGGWVPHSCDYAWITGKTRSAQVKDPIELDPENCPFFEPGQHPIKDPFDGQFSEKGGKHETD